MEYNWHMEYREAFEEFQEQLDAAMDTFVGKLKSEGGSGLTSDRVRAADNFNANEKNFDADEKNYILTRIYITFSRTKSYIKLFQRVIIRRGADCGHPFLAMWSEVGRKKACFLGFHIESKCPDRNAGWLAWNSALLWGVMLMTSWLIFSFSCSNAAIFPPTSFLAWFALCSSSSFAHQSLVTTSAWVSACLIAYWTSISSSSNSLAFVDCAAALIWRKWQKTGKLWNSSVSTQNESEISISNIQSTR